MLHIAHMLILLEHHPQNKNMIKWLGCSNHSGAIISSNTYFPTGTQIIIEQAQYRSRYHCLVKKKSTIQKFRAMKILPISRST